MKKILFYISFLLVMVILLNMECSNEDDRERIIGGEIIEQYYICDYRSAYNNITRFTKKEDTFYITITGQDKIFIYNIADRKLDTITSNTMNSIFSSITGITIYKDLFVLVDNYYKKYYNTINDYDKYNIVITSDFEDYKIYAINYPSDFLEENYPLNFSEYIKYVKNIAYSEKHDYFVYINDLERAVRVDYDSSNDQFVYNNTIFNISSDSEDYGISIYDDFLWTPSAFATLFIDEIYIKKINLSSLETKTVFMIDKAHSLFSKEAPEYIKNWYPYDLHYDGEYLYVLSNGGEIGKLYIEKIRLD